VQGKRKRPSVQADQSGGGIETGDYEGDLIGDEKSRRGDR
jgi:hypothetical protein